VTAPFPPADAEARYIAALLSGTLRDPFAYLGPHREARDWTVRGFFPGAESVTLLDRAGLVLRIMTEIDEHGVFAGIIDKLEPYVFRIAWPDATHETEDPYAFGLILGDLDLHLFSEGTHWDMAKRLGAREATLDGVSGVCFAVWAPNAKRVSVIGDFNLWDHRRHPMRLRHSAGVWELFVPRLAAGERYKFDILAANGARLQKADPLARATEKPPATASIVASDISYRWTDDDWMERRLKTQWQRAPITIYELHAQSWLRPEDNPNGVRDWRALADRLIPYVAQLGFTHVELLPIMEHPFGGSWGYQPLSQFAPSARFGEPQEFAHFVDECHRAGIGVILDWVPAHFPTDAHGLAHFDGTALYEHEDPREGFHRDWNTLIYNLGRREVSGFLLASALYWLETFHVDGLRVDAVASMLYRDYSRRNGEWIPNRYGGRENLESVAFLRRLNALVAEQHPGVLTIAEESTAWPGVTARLMDGGLGFSFKWNMGWMHDTLSYLGRDPVHRRFHHNDMTFGLLYAFSEHFVLPLSHDEVVHGKGSLYDRAPGDDWRKYANLRAYFSFMWTHPGKKLLFMGGEIGQHSEWSHDGEVQWSLLEQPRAAGLQRFVADLNRFYAEKPALHAGDCEGSGFRWIVNDDYQNSVFVYERRYGNEKPIIVVLNMTPLVRQSYRIGVPVAGFWKERLNSDGETYGGGNVGNAGGAFTQANPAHGYKQSLDLILPPLGALILEWER
jgi:1,4-alpha-glucan branching enzyme